MTTHNEDDTPDCEPEEHSVRVVDAVDDRDIDRAVRLFKALGDTQRFRLLLMLQAGEACVSELVAKPGEPLSSVSSRLRLLRLEGLVKQRREGKHVYYSLEDEHIAELLRNAIEHSREER